MSRPSPVRLLSAGLLFVAIPAAAQSALSSHSPTGTFRAIDDNLRTDLSRPPTSEITDEERGEILIVRKRYQAAIQEFTKITSPSAFVWNQIGIAYQMMYDYKDAMRCYKESLKLNPQNANALNNQATVQDAMMNFSAAERSYRKSLKLEPNSALTLKNLGTNLLMQHKYKEGSAAYKQALSLDPHIFEDHGGARMNTPATVDERATAAYFQARSCSRAGLYECAITFLRKAMNEGFTVEQVSQEQDFAPLRSTVAYINLIAREQ